MLTEIRHSKITSFVWGFMAFYLLNISVDVTSFFDENKNKTYNEQESIVELIFEKVLGYEEAIPENATNDIEQNSTMKKVFSIDKFVLPFYEIKTEMVALKTVEKTFFYSNNIFLKASLEIHSPPPDV